MRYVFLGVGVVLSLCAATLLAQKASESRYWSLGLGTSTAVTAIFWQFWMWTQGQRPTPRFSTRCRLMRRARFHITPSNFTPGHPLFANGFQGNRTFRFDLADPLHPRLVGSLDTIPSLAFPHSFARLPNGNVLATCKPREQTVPLLTAHSASG